MQLRRSMKPERTYYRIEGYFSKPQECKGSSADYTALSLVS